MENGEGRRSRVSEPTGAALGPLAGAPDRRISPAAQRLLDALRSHRQPVTVAALAAGTSLHPNTVREHLDSLVRAGFAARDQEQPHGRGRPAGIYRATSALSEASEYAALAVVLASTIARTSPHPGTDAEAAGEDWGRDLARRRGAAPISPESARDRALELLDDLGFAPDRAPDTPSSVRLTRCPLLEAARSNPRIVCGVHLGLLRGVLSEYGADPTGSALVPFAEPGACMLVVPPLELSPHPPG